MCYHYRIVLFILLERDGTRLSTRMFAQDDSPIIVCILLPVQHAISMPRISEVQEEVRRTFDDSSGTVGSPKLCVWGGVG